MTNKVKFGEFMKIWKVIFIIFCLGASPCLFADNGSAEYQKGKYAEYAADEGGDYGAALKWFRKASAKGNTDADVDIGRFYENGWGVAKNYKKAMELYQGAAKRGNNKGEFMIGLMYKRGHGVPVDYEKALYWVEKSVAHGNQFGKMQVEDIKKLIAKQPK